MSMKDYMKPLHRADDVQNALQADGISILVFSADWCPDCRFIEPFMEGLVHKYHHYTFYYVDRDQHIEVAQEFAVMGIPSFVAIGYGKEQGRFVSKLRKSEAEIDAFLASLM